MSSPPLGHIRLYSHAVGPMPAGRYRLLVEQDVDLPSTEDTAVDESFDANAEHWELPKHERPIEVTAPRFRMQGAELQSLFPPPFAEGAFSNRFAQAMLRRRTLPWDRDPDSSTLAREPWLMLVVLADGEGEMRTDVPLTDATLTQLRSNVGLTAAQARAAGSCDVLDVTGRTIRKSFPSRADLPFLTHVREVNLLDTEYAGTDDDGFIAVVASNRVLRGGVSYSAYLVSVEGQLQLLPSGQSGNTTPEVGPVTDAGMPPFFLLPGVLGSAGSGAVHEVSEAVVIGGTTRLEGADLERRREMLRFVGTTDRLDELVVGPATSAAATDVSVATPVDFVVGDYAVHRFPVLAHWTFTTEPGGDFETLMKRIDVGVLTTVGEDVVDPPTVIGTGHALLDRTTRAGESAPSWYRGPLAPLQLDDRDDVPLHAAEQAIRVGSDGIEDISYAAAFEVGRLLALSSPAFVSGLIAWRRRGSNGSWRGLRHEALPNLFPELSLDRLDLERYMSFGAIEQLLAGRDPLDPLGPLNPLGPLVNPVPLRETYDPVADVRALEGIGLARSFVEQTLGIDGAVAVGSPGQVGVDIGLVDTGSFDDVVAVGSTAWLAGALDEAFNREAGVFDVPGGPR